MKIGILTLPLHTNYGGILQAWALQTVLERMGHECMILNRDTHQKPKMLPFCYALIKRIIKILLGRQTEPLFKEFRDYREYPIISQNTSRFVNARLNVNNIVSYESISDDFDAYVVGSDQVWRPGYFNEKLIKHAFLGFATDQIDCRRIAYAASFGTDKWEYTSNQTSQCSALAKKFDKISVREKSGVKLCADKLRVEASVVLDPTMLLSVEDYDNIIESANTIESKGDLLTYILNPNEDTEEAVAIVSEKLSLTPFASNSRYEDYRAPIEEKIQMSVEQWLRNFRDAQYVITDSFHACVFSIIFHKDFIVMGNKKRGLSRFETLLSTFGLMDRMAEKTSDISDILCKKIDWSKVQETLEREKDRSINYLMTSLR